MTARVAIFDGPGRPFRFEEIPLPDRLAAGEVLVRLSMATICGSDLHTVAGRRQEPVPCVLGHEGIGRVAAAGAGREEWLGKRVTWTLADSCGSCRPCAELDLPQKCEHLFKYGHASLGDGTGLNGTYASHILLRPGTHLVEVPDSVPDALAASANCSLATMVAVVEDLPQPCRTAVIQGAGLLGLYGCALLKARGVKRVWVIDPDPTRLELATTFGGEPTTTTDGASGSADVVIEVAGAPGVVPEGLRMLGVGGQYRFAGMVHPDSALEITGETIIRRCLTLRGYHNYGPRHLKGAVVILRAFRPADVGPWSSLISPPMPLERLDEAMSLAASRRWARVAVTMDG
jgi:putative phosphonate catabolism associated alcohol dehydrogenase